MTQRTGAVVRKRDEGQPVIRKAKLSDYVLDPRNANRSTLRGQSVLENSIEQFGPARSGVVDKDGVMRAGNHTAEQLAAAGIEEVIEVEANGKQWVVVKRTDMDAKTGQAYGVADNRVAQLSIDFDPDVLASLAADGLDLSGLWDNDELIALGLSGGIRSGDPSVFFLSESEEWYTPTIYIEAARNVLGDIDVDPASNTRSQEFIKAKFYFTKNTNGLNKDWRGRVWLNPPYGTDKEGSLAGQWAKRLIEQYDAGITTAAILLVNAVTERNWFQPLYRFPICFTNHRIRFEGGESESENPICGSAFIYLGNEISKFAETFKQFGVIMTALAPEREA